MAPGGGVAAGVGGIHGDSLQGREGNAKRGRTARTPSSPGKRGQSKERGVSRNGTENRNNLWLGVRSDRLATTWGSPASGGFLVDLDEVRERLDRRRDEGHPFVGRLLAHGIVDCYCFRASR